MARRLITLICLSSLVYGSENLKGQALYRVNQGKIAEGIEAYKELVKTLGKQDHELLEQISLSILAKGFEEREPEKQILALFGASVSMNDKVDRFFELAYRSPYPQIQLAALNAATKTHTEMSNFLLGQAIGSSHPLIRLEAALLMAERKTPGASIKIESLMQKMESEVHFIFPRLFAMIGDKESTKILRRLVTHPDEKVRAESLIAIGTANRDDLIMEVKRCLNHPDPMTLEAAIFAAGALKDETTIPFITRHTQSSNAAVRLAALNSLAKMKDKGALNEIIYLASEENPFAITLLGEYEEGDPVLIKLLDSQNSTTRINACASLLKHKNPAGLKGLPEVLIKSPRDLCFIPLVSQGGSLKSVKSIPSSKQNLAENPVAFEMSLSFREEVLRDAFNLPDQYGFEIIRILFQVEQTDLIPLAMELLESHPNEKTIAYLKEQEQKLGSPFIRYFAALALMNMGIEGPYSDKIASYLINSKDIDLVKFRPFIPWELRGEITPYELTVNDHSSLFIAAIEGLAQKRDEKGIQTLIEMLSKRDDPNRYIIAGILLRTIQ